MASTEQKPEIVIHHLNNSRSERICESLPRRDRKVTDLTLVPVWALEVRWHAGPISTLRSNRQGARRN